MFAPRTPIDRTRRVMAWLAVALWVLGFEVAPNLHLGLHDHLVPHSHDGEVADAHEDDASHHHDDDAPHHHDDASHHHDDGLPADFHEFAANEPEFADSARREVADDARDEPVASRLDPAHGDHDLLHRGVAIATPPIAQPSIAQAPVVVLARLRPLIEHVPSPEPIRSRARGPPMLAATCRAVDCTA